MTARDHSARAGRNRQAVFETWTLASVVMTTSPHTVRTDPPLAADEATTLVAFLDYHRDTLRMKTEGLTAEQLAQPLAPSSLTLGALLKHVALNEASWFGEVLHGRPMPEPWASADWDADRDWE